MDPQKISKLYGLASFHDRENDEFLTMGVGALSFENRGAAVQRVVDEIADRVRLVADDGEIFAKVNILNDRVDDQRFCHETGK